MHGRFRFGGTEQQQLTLSLNVKYTPPLTRPPGFTDRSLSRLRMSDQQPPPPVVNSLAEPIDLNQTLSSEQLLQGRREVLIRHGSEVYRLRLTRQGKLILQK
jgi:hemin uptake protein HemP